METLASTGVVESITTAFTSIQTDIIAALAAIAPIAILVMGTFLIWRMGTKFFKGLAKS